MRVFGWILIGLGALISVGLNYCTNIDQQSNLEWSLALIEQQTKLGFPLWLSGLPLMIAGVLLTRKSSSTVTSTVLNSGTADMNTFTEPDTPVQSGGKLSVDAVDESVFMSDWKLHVQSEIKGMLLPNGAQIVENPTQGVQLGLILTRTTPQGTKQAFHATAEMLSKIPTPPRFRVELIDVMATGVPIKNIAIGGLSKFFAKQDFIITEQIDGLDIRFNQPDALWER